MDATARSMGHWTRRFATATLLMLFACTAKTQLPVQDEEFALNLSTEQLVCQVRSIAAEQQLSFHYGTFKASGSRATFRLIGNQFEIVLYNPEHRYVLQAYDMSANGRVRERTLLAFARFKRALLARPSGSCAH